MLSILIPAFRVYSWNRMFKSILEAWSQPVEVIIVSHYKLPKELQDDPRVKWIYDKGNPTRKRQIALLNARYPYVAWFADDGIFLPRALDKVYQEFGFDDVVSFKYGDVLPGKFCPAIMKEDEYYDFSHFSNLVMDGIPYNCRILSFGAMRRDVLKELGGWDCQFETLAMADNDLAIRLNKAGKQINLSKEIMIELLHVPGAEGDHGPVYHAQIDHDEPLFEKMYENDKNKDRMIINLNNWKDAPEVWNRRPY